MANPRAWHRPHTSVPKVGSSAARRPAPRHPGQPVRGEAGAMWTAWASPAGSRPGGSANSLHISGDRVAERPPGDAGQHRQHLPVLGQTAVAAHVSGEDRPEPRRPTLTVPCPPQITSTWRTFCHRPLTRRCVILTTNCQVPPAVVLCSSVRRTDSPTAFLTGSGRTPWRTPKVSFQRSRGVGLDTALAPNAQYEESDSSERWGRPTQFGG